MKRTPILLSVFTALGTGLPALPVPADAGIASVEFIGMEAPETVQEKADIYTRARMKITYATGDPKTYNLKYHQLMATTEEIDGEVVGGLYDANDNPLRDRDGHMASDAPDGSSLMDVLVEGEAGDDGNDRSKNRTLALVTQFEYKELFPNDGVDYEALNDAFPEAYEGFWSRLPALMSLATLEQDAKTGALRVLDYEPISFKDVNGGWIHCGSTLSSWNTHIGSEEYEPDAKVREGMLRNPPVDLRAGDSDDYTDIDSFSHYYFGTGTPAVSDPSPAQAKSPTANPYHYGLVPEVTVSRNGETQVVKHYAPGRFAREMQEMASDQRTAIGGDDGKNTGLFMFVADKATDLSAGTLYAAKIKQTSEGGENHASFDLDWIRLGHASDEEIEAMVEGGIKFSEIFDYLPADTAENTSGFTKVATYMGTEWLRLKEGMEKAAAFLETRRYAALLGASTEFSKMEYIGFNEKDRKFYIVISRAERGMSDGEGDIRIAENQGGLILEMTTGQQQKDRDGNPIESRFVGTSLKSIPELEGGWPIPEVLDTAGGGEKDGKDAEGNACVQEKVCGPDNLRYVDSIRTLFIGEDTSRRNNNYVWAFNIDTRKLSRILSVPMAAEATGLTIAPNYHGHAYILSNFQHPGERGIGKYKGADKDAVLAQINRKWSNRKKAAIGYIGTESGALPPLD